MQVPRGTEGDAHMLELWLVLGQAAPRATSSGRSSIDGALTVRGLLGDADLTMRGEVLLLSTGMQLLARSRPCDSADAEILPSSIAGERRVEGAQHECEVPIGGTKGTGGDGEICEVRVEGVQIELDVPSGGTGGDGEGSVATVTAVAAGITLVGAT